MSNWDLMMPGMGLTAIGLAGVVLAYAGIAHTFIDGLHALAGLTMFVGLIFLAVGILDGGISTSNKAKATTLVILSIGLGFGMFGLTYNTSNFTITLAGVLMGIAFPSIIIAYLAMKHPTVVKPIGSIVAMAGATGIIMWLAFGFVGPDTYMIPQAVVEPAPAPDTAIRVEIPAGSAVEGAPGYDPGIAEAGPGDVVRWTNSDDADHTITSAADFGETFDSGLIAPGGTFEVDATALGGGTHGYYCKIHPWLVGTLEVEGAIPVVIPDGAGIASDGQIYYSPESLSVDVGDIVSWENLDVAIHTVTSGSFEGGSDGLFDSEFVSAGGTFVYTFEEPGTYDYYCTLHSWMTGSVSVGQP